MITSFTALQCIVMIGGFALLTYGIIFNSQPMILFGEFMAFTVLMCMCISWFKTHNFCKKQSDTSIIVNNPLELENPTIVIVKEVNPISKKNREDDPVHIP